MFLEITQRIGRSNMRSHIHQNNAELYYLRNSNQLYSMIWGRWPWQSSMLPRGFEIDFDRAEYLKNVNNFTVDFVEIPAVGFKLIEQANTIEICSRAFLSGAVISVEKGFLSQSSVYILTQHGEPLFMEALLKQCG